MSNQTGQEKMDVYHLGVTESADVLQYLFSFSSTVIELPGFIGEHVQPEYRLYFPPYFVTRCGHVTKFWLIGWKQMWLVRATSGKYS